MVQLWMIQYVVVLLTPTEESWTVNLLDLDRFLGRPWSEYNILLFMKKQKKIRESENNNI